MELRAEVDLLQRLEIKLRGGNRSRLTRLLWLLYVQGKIARKLLEAGIRSHR